MEKINTEHDASLEINFNNINATQQLVEPNKPHPSVQPPDLAPRKHAILTAISEKSLNYLQAVAVCENKHRYGFTPDELSLLTEYKGTQNTANFIKRCRACGVINDYCACK